ncbi:MAG: magnesium/cobalt transporter CorA [Nanoarchaeota archaeon]|nr:magnesium/cobalt transporter CorA [Nanoarchaeota archaeon]
MLTVQKLENGKVLQGKFEDIKKRGVVWADFQKPSKEEIEKIAEFVGISAVEIREFLHANSRPLIANLEKYSIIVLQSPQEKGEDVTMPLLAFISKKSNDLITMHMHEMPSLNRMKEWEDKRKARIFEKGTTFILYNIIDEIASTYSLILSAIDERIDKLEEGIYHLPQSQRLMGDSLKIKKSLIYFYKALIANREVVSGIEKEYGEFLDKKGLSKFRLLYSDFTQLVELTVTYRDILTTTIEVYLSVVSNNLNVTVKKLTAWGAIILLPTLISGIYGMNFKYMPEIPWVHGYWFALSLMLVLVILAYAYFKRKDWI